jgi:hypothetical protein
VETRDAVARVDRALSAVAQALASPDRIDPVALRRAVDELRDARRRGDALLRDAQEAVDRALDALETGLAKAPPMDGQGARPARPAKPPGFRAAT